MNSPALRYAERDLETLRRATMLCRRRLVAVQAGACLGVFPEFLASRFAAVYSFEPDAELFRRSIARCISYQNIVWMRAAVGDERVMVRTECSRRDGSNRPVHEGLTHVVPGGIVPTMRIDDFELDECDLLCLDVEGRELSALRGARETIERCRPVIMVEINKQAAAEGVDPEDVRGELRSHGYRLEFKAHSDEVYVP